MVRARLAAAAVATALAAAACGGGGSGGVAQPSPSPTPSGPPGVVLVPTVKSAACPAGNAGQIAGTPVQLAEGMPAGPAPRGPFYVDPKSNAAAAAHADPAHAALYHKLSDQADALVVGEWLDDVRGSVTAYTKHAAKARATGVLMIYAIPHRDADAGFSAGGEPDAASYRAFTRQVAQGIGDRAAVVVLEPDSLGQITSLPAAQQAERYALLRDAVNVYTALPGVSLYLDGTNCGWTPAAEIAQRLRKAGVEQARGFAVNVANYYRTADEVARARVVSALTGGAHFVVDTSRNGRGPVQGDDNPWCNPPGRGLGTRPTTSTGDPLADAFLWIKTPGQSDGECGRGDPPAGTFWPQQALELARNANW